MIDSSASVVLGSKSTCGSAFPPGLCFWKKGSLARLREKKEWDVNKRKPNVVLTTSGGRTVAHTASILLQLGRDALITHPSFCAQEVAEKGCGQALVCGVC